MAIYSASIRTTNTTQGQASWVLKAGASWGFRLLEYGVSLNSAAQVAYVIGPASVPCTLSSSITLLAEDTGNTTASVTTVGTSYTVDAGYPTIYYKRFIHPPIVGGGVIWTLPQGLLMAKGTDLVAFNMCNGTNFDAWFVVDE